MDGVREFATALAEEGVQVNFVEAPEPEPEPRKAYMNVEMERMLAALEKHLGRTDKVGYAAARNTRILRAAAAEYLERREELVAKHGEPELGEGGEPTGRTMLKLGTPAFDAFLEEMAGWEQIKHEPKLYTIPASEAMGAITGAEMLEIDWMFDWEEDA